jgi:hypothetical protein
MANEQFTIDLGDDQRALLVTDDEAWLREKLRQEPGATRIRVRYDGDEVEGHRSGAGLGVRVIADDLDTEGHAIALHFPSREEADAFRKRLMLTGVIVGSVAIGAVTGAGLASMQVQPSSAAGSAASAASATDADRDLGLMDFGGAAAAASGASASASTSDANADIGLMDFGGTGTAADADEPVSGGPSISGPTPR